MKKKFTLFLFLLFSTIISLNAQQLSPEELKAGRWLSQEEYNNRANLNISEPTEPPSGPIQPVAEFEPMQGVLIAYPFGIPMNLIVEMSEIVMVTTIVATESQATSVSNMYASNGVNMSNVDFLVEPHDTYWTRDYGPWFIREEDQISIVNFTYNRPRPDDDIMPINVATMLDIPYYNMPVVHTGGNYMNDGYGIAAQTELIYEENTISNDQVDQYMEDYLGITDNYVITDPLGDYIKHIDCWAKFLDTDKVLVAEVPESDPRYDDYEYAANYFASRNCAYGYPFEVIRVYAPGNYPYTPYTNSLILNNKVFLPITGSPWDDEAIATYEEAMPGYEIVPILDGNYDWINSDALHCRTHEIADIGMLKISSMPLYGEQNFGEGIFALEAEIFPYSGEALIPDSLLLFVKINSGEFYSQVMFQNGEHAYAEFVNVSPGDTVYYYFHAADESGRSENLPYIGAADPFMFTVENIEQFALEVSPESLLAGEGERVLVRNTGNMPVDIEDIHGGQYYEMTYQFGEFNPEIPSYPYTLFPNDSIEIFIDFYIGVREIWWDSLNVVTADSTYIAMIGNDISGTNEINLSNTVNLSPNPISHSGQIDLFLNQAAAVQIDIFQLNGQWLTQLESSRLSSGKYIYYWDGKNNDGTEIEAGIYLVKVQVNDEVSIKKWIKM